MTKEKAKELSEILKAYSEGKTIQRFLNNKWNDLDAPIYFLSAYCLAMSL